MKKKSNKKVWIIAGVVIALLAVGAANNDTEEIKANISGETRTTAVNDALGDNVPKLKPSARAAEVTEISTETTEAKTEAETEIKYYQEGVYKVGKDLPAGEYLLISHEDQYIGGYMCISSDSNQKDIIINELFKTFHYITVEVGQYLELTRCGAVSVEDESLNLKSYNDLGAGMYKVGADIPAGEYRLTADKDATIAYSCIYDSSAASRKIISNDIINNNAYVTVKDGQYLLLQACTAAFEE